MNTFNINLGDFASKWYRAFTIFGLILIVLSIYLRWYPRIYTSDMSGEFALNEIKLEQHLKELKSLEHESDESKNILETTNPHARLLIREYGLLVDEKKRLFEEKSSLINAVYYGKRSFSDEEFSLLMQFDVDEKILDSQIQLHQNEISKVMNFNDGTLLVMSGVLTTMTTLSESEIYPIFDEQIRIAATMDALHDVFRIPSLLIFIFGFLMFVFGLSKWTSD